jgi:hypothetical protein
MRNFNNKANNCNDPDLSWTYPQFDSLDIYKYGMRISVGTQMINLKGSLLKYIQHALFENKAYVVECLEINNFR